MDAKKNAPIIVAGLAGLGLVAWFFFRRSGDELAIAGDQVIPPAGSSEQPTPEVEQDENSLSDLLSNDARIPPMIRQWAPYAARYAFANLPKRYEIDPENFARLILAHIRTESAGDAGITGDAGYAYGLMQINIHNGNNPEFAAIPRAQRFDPDTNIEYGSRLLSTLLDLYRKRYGPFDALRAGVSAYNAGPNGVDRAIARGRDPATATYRGEYTDKVWGFFESYGGVLPAVNA
jgi:soluble lytic murein transglycosylase-like protein